MLLFHSELRQKADEEGLPNGDPIDRERHEQDEEQQRPHHVIGPGREVDADGTAGHPDREHAHRLHAEGQERDPDHQPDVTAKDVHALVQGAQRPFEPEAAQQRHETAQESPHPAGEEQHCEDDRPDDEHAFDPEVGADVVLADGKREADSGERQRCDAAEGTLQEDDRRHLAEPPRMPA